MISAALVASLVGYGSTIALVLAAAAALGATPGQTASWVLAICVAKGLGSALLSAWSRLPVVLAWSTPGAALIAASEGVGMAEAVAAFLLAAGLIVLTGVLRPLGHLIGAIPIGLAAGMLAGVLLPFCLAVPVHAAAMPTLILPLVAVFVLVRVFSPAYAVLAALACGLALTFGAGTPLPAGPFDWPVPEFIAPAWDIPVLIGLGVPLYLVTMASQNLPGFAVLQSAGYTPPVAKALTVSGLISGIAALFGAHTVNMAAITAAICLGEEVHPDRSQRWKVGVVYGAVWLCLGLFGPLILAAILALPGALIASIAGLALVNPLIGALGQAFAEPSQRFAAAVTLVVTASGAGGFGIGSAFWGLLAGLVVWAVDLTARRLRGRSAAKA